MAEIDFPNSPTNGQVFTSGALSWTYSAGVGWLLNSSDGLPGGADSFELLQISSTGTKNWKAPESWWTYKLVAGATPAAAGEFTADNTSFPTELKFHITDSSTRNRTDDLRRLAVGDVIHIVGLSATGSWRTMVTAAPALSGSIVTIKVANIAGTSTGFGGEWTMGTNGYHRFEPQYAGSSAAQLPAKAFAANYGGGAIPAQSTTYLYVGAQTIADGFQVVNNTEIVALQSMRVKATAMITLAGGAGAWAIITLTHRRNEADVRSWPVVWDNNGSYKGAMVDAVIDMQQGDSLRVGIAPDVAGTVDGRSWVNVVQVANPYSAVLPSPWNSAWGVVASQVFSTATVIPASTNGNPGLSVTWNAIAGRLYRISLTGSHIFCTGVGLLSVYWADGAGNAYEHVSFRSHAANAEMDVNAFMDRAYAPGSNTVRLVSGDSGGQHTWQYGGYTSKLSVEDIGPISGAVAVPNPTPGWITPTFENSWRAFAAGWSQPGYRKIGDVVYLRGMFTGGTAAAPRAFTLPVGYRPVERTVFDARSDGNTAGNETARVDVIQAGAASEQGGVWLLGGYLNNGTGWVSLDGLSFSVS